MRHGQTELNKRQVLQGRSDYPLNEEGIRQAQEAAEELRNRGIVFDHVFTSPLIRAVRTAEIVAPGVHAVTDERLIEMDYGPYENTDLRNLPPEIVYFFRDFVNHPAPEGMEQLASVVSRVGEFLEEIRGLPGNILVSTHAIAMKGALEYLTPASDGRYWSTYIGNCAVFTAENSEKTLGMPEELWNKRTKD